MYDEFYGGNCELCVYGKAGECKLQCLKKYDNYHDDEWDDDFSDYDFDEDYDESFLLEDSVATVCTNCKYFMKGCGHRDFDYDNLCPAK